MLNAGLLAAVKKSGYLAEYYLPRYAENSNPSRAAAIVYGATGRGGMVAAHAFAAALCDLAGNRRAVVRGQRLARLVCHPFFARQMVKLYSFFQQLTSVNEEPV